MPATNKPLSFDVFPGHIYVISYQLHIVRIHASGIPVSLPYCCYGEVLRERPTLFLKNVTQKRLNLASKQIAVVLRVFSSFRNGLRSSVERKIKNDLGTR